MPLDPLRFENPITEDKRPLKASGWFQVWLSRLAQAFNELVARVASILQVAVSGVSAGTRRTINFIAGGSIGITATDDPANERIDVTIEAEEVTPDIGTDNGTVNIDNADVGTWKQVIAATTYDSLALLVGFQCRLNQAGVLVKVLVDFGVGAAAAEVEKISNIPVRGTTIAGTIPVYVVIPFEIPAGSRIAARFSGTVNDDTIDISVTVLSKTP